MTEAQIELVRGSMDGGLEQELLSFWERRAGFGGEEARRRLPEVVCVLRRGGELAGASSVFADELELIGGWRFWVFRGLLATGLEDQQRALIRATFNALDGHRDGAPGAPVGLCVLLDEQQRRMWPQAEWSDPPMRMIYAGYLDDGRQVRIAYFSDQVDAMSTPEPQGGWSAPPGYEIVVFAEQSRISTEDVISAWVAGGVVPRVEAERRIGELLLVGIDPHGGLAAITTAYLDRNDQLLADFWHVRGFVSEAHRKSTLGVALSVAGRRYLENRYVSGRDQSGLGFVFEVENEGLKRYFPHGRWYESDVMFIGENARGAHVRVHYFPGVYAPEPIPSIVESGLARIPR